MCEMDEVTRDVSVPALDRCPRRVAFVLGTTVGGIGAHVRMLAAGCAVHGIAVTVLGPPAAGDRFGFAALPGVAFIPVEFGDRPRPRDAIAVLRLRRALCPAAAGQPDVVHAHGLRAAALTVLALSRHRARARVRFWARARARARSRPPGVVATVHNAPPSGGGVPALIYRLLEALTARGADLVLCVSPDLEARMRAAGARHVRRALVPPPAPVPPAPVPPASASPAPHPPPAGGAARPMVLAAGRLAAQKGFGTLLTAAVSWRDMDPEPLLVIAGEGPLSARLRSQAARLGLDARFPGHRDDLPALLARAAVVVLPSLWEGQPLVLQEALRAGVPVVASRAGGIPDLTGDAAVLVPPGDAVRLGQAVRSVLADPVLSARLRERARERAAMLASQDDALTEALACYAELIPARDTRVVPLTSTCLCLLTRVSGGDPQVLLGHKKTGLGTGKIVGLGGHVEPDETPAGAAAREVKEEAGIDVAPCDLTEAAHLTFIFPARPEWDMTVAVFTSAGWTGEATETAEITPEWFPVAGLPLDGMWDDARHWLPRVLAGERVRATFTYAGDCDTVAECSIAPLAPPPDRLGRETYRYPPDMRGMGVTLAPNVTSCISDGETPAGRRADRGYQRSQSAAIRPANRSTSGPASAMDVARSGSISASAYAAAMPAARNRAADSAHTPATATTGTAGERDAAARATPSGAFPRSVCASSAPSPVITSRAPSRR
jgi:glycosyltransferase involved in cell wall biosynthesis/8-oxo-dGTP pyrophosphatase MutT (NUDIX family)